jgi:Domain of unknown function (DUF6456)
MTREGGILKLMLNKRGVIIATGMRSDVLAIVPRGDKRCRPVGWVEIKTLTKLLAHGSVVQKGDTYILDPDYMHRKMTEKYHGNRDAFANQHRQMEARDIYHPDGIKRPVRINSHLSTLTRLANLKDKTGQSFLQPDEIEAAQRFAADYARSMMSAIATQSYGDAASSGARTTNTAENISISAMDARKRIMDSLESVGPGLDRALTVLCSGDMSIGALELSENWAKGAGKTVLKLALSRLSEYYGCRAGVTAKRRRQN